MQEKQGGRERGRKKLGKTSNPYMAFSSAHHNNNKKGFRKHGIAAVERIPIE